MVAASPGFAVSFLAFPLISSSIPSPPIDVFLNWYINSSRSTPVSLRMFTLPPLPAGAMLRLSPLATGSGAASCFLGVLAILMAASRRAISLPSSAEFLPKALFSQVQRVEQIAFLIEGLEFEMAPLDVDVAKMKIDAQLGLEP